MINDKWDHKTSFEFSGLQIHEVDGNSRSINNILTLNIVQTFIVVIDN